MQSLTLYPVEKTNFGCGFVLVLTSSMIGSGYETFTAPAEPTLISAEGWFFWIEARLSNISRFTAPAETTLISAAVLQVGEGPKIGVRLSKFTTV